MAEPQYSLLARRWAVDVKASNDDEGEFVRVRGINSMSDSLDPNFEDSTDYDSDGWTRQEKTMQGWSLELGVIQRADAASDELDPGQGILEEASDKFGAASRVEVRWYERDGTKAYSGTASVQYEPQGGSPSDLATVNITLQGDGKRERIEHPDLGE